MQDPAPSQWCTRTPASAPAAAVDALTDLRRVVVVDQLACAAVSSDEVFVGVAEAADDAGHMIDVASVGLAYVYGHRRGHQRAAPVPA